ncbi:MAG: hypothetical protein JBO36_20460, partial [Candidatus Thiodiazotropha taylori]|nr:hypothetical protein [Candidatus Thiodiazotropha taylori]
NNAEDMSEEFPIGSLVFFSTSGCLADFPMSSFVLTGKQVNAADSDSEKRIYESIHFSQLVMTMHGLRLVSLRPEISESTVIGERSIIGFAKYSIRQY